MAFPFNFFQDIANDISGRIVGPEGVNPLELIDEPRYETRITGEVEKANNDRFNYTLNLAGDFTPHSVDSGFLSLAFSGEFSYLNDRAFYEIGFSGEVKTDMISFTDYSTRVTGEIFAALCDRYFYSISMSSGEVYGDNDKISTEVTYRGRFDGLNKDSIDVDVSFITGYYSYAAAVTMREVEDNLSMGIFIVSGQYYQPVS